MHDPQEPHLNVMKRVLRYLPGTTDLRQLFRYYVFLGDNLLTWSSKRQDMLSRSSAEAEYREVANAVVETSWIHKLLREFHTPLSIATLVYCDNVSVVYMSANPMQHPRIKHIEIPIHFVRDKVAAENLSRLFEILSLSGSFMLSEVAGRRSRIGELSVALSALDGQVLGGNMDGLLTAASPVVVIVGSFVPSSQKQTITIGNNEAEVFNLEKHVMMVEEEKGS
nr:ribonuclease H-like domain-containing protein [Tanacetum cinerariifolium]